MTVGAQRCVSCEKPLSPYWDKCKHCGAEREPEDPAGWPDVITRTYRGSLELANAAYAEEAGRLSGSGFRPTGQVYSGRSRSGALAVVAIASVVLGLLVFLPLFVLGLFLGLLWLALPSGGTLSVTYQR